MIAPVRQTAASPDLALSGIRVIELSSPATQYCGKLFRDMGADVVLVEPPGGSNARRDGRFFQGAEDDLGSISFRYYNAGKDSLCLDLSTQNGQDAFLDLCRKADLLVEGTEPGTLDRLGLSYERLSACNPRLVLTRITPFGQDGPFATYKADDLTLLALGGLLSLGGYADGQPVAIYGSQSILAASLFAAVASMAAVIAAEETGRGDHVDVSMQEAVVMALENAAQFYQLEGKVRRRSGGISNCAGNGQFRCADGYFYLLAGGLSSIRFWRSAIDWLNEEEAPGATELRHPRWQQREFIESDEAKAIFETIFAPFARQRTQEQLYAACRERRIPGAPVLTPLGVVQDKQRAHRGFFVESSNLVPGAVVISPGAPYRLSATPCQPPGRVPRLGESLNGMVDRSYRAPKKESERTSRRPLEGVRITDFTWIGAGSYTTKILADLGADVIKIESTQKIDDLRLSPPFAGGIKGVNRSGYFADRNTGKRSVTLNLKTDCGVQFAKNLIRRSDIVTDNFAPGVMARLGLDYGQLAALKPALVCLSMSAQGADGPEANVIGFGLTLGAMTGLHDLSGDPSREPVGSGTHYPDHIPNPCHGAFAVLAALRFQRRTGRGQFIDLAQTEPTIAMIGPAIIDSSYHRRNLQRTSNRNNIDAPRGVFPCSDPDRWIAISVRSDEEWVKLTATLDANFVARPEWRGRDGRLHDQDEIEASLAHFTSRWDAYELMQHLQSDGIAAGVVQTASDLVERDPQLAFREHWRWFDHLEMGRTIHNGQPFLFLHSDVFPRSPAPLLGQHTDQVAKDLLGLSPERIVSLRDRNVLS